jgi:hypothetical protein
VWGILRFMRSTTFSLTTVVAGLACGHCASVGATKDMK